MVIHACCCFFVSPHSHSLKKNASGTSSAACLPHQSSILLQLKAEFTFQKPTDDVNDTYPKMKYWNTEGDVSDCCLWDGISCDTATGHVTAIDLSSSWLYGPLTSNSSLFMLLHLHKLNFAFNNFASCTIPSEFSKLSRLTYLNLSSSVFSGHIPYVISRLTNLVVLDLSVGTSTTDGYLYVRQGQLGRLITQNMTNLRQLYLDGTNLSSPVLEFFGNLSSLTHLSLQKCYLFGELPKNIFLQLPNLQFMDLSRNYDLKGKLPDSIGNLKSLELLDLRYCNFSGIVPPSFWNLSQLSKFSLAHNHFNGQLPHTIGNLAKLTEFSLLDNHFSGGLPSSLGNLRQLNYLTLGYNNFSGEVPTSLGNLTQLIYLDLSYNSFSGHISSVLGNHTQLKHLYLLYNRFTGRIPSSLEKFTQLENLFLSSNLLDGELPVSFPHTIKIIYLDSTGLTGSILSTSIANLTFLYDLVLSSNSFTGVIPWSLFELPCLDSLSLDYNQFTGSLNISSNSSSPLTYLSLIGNKLGGVPSSVSKLTMLTELYLSFNDFSGTLDFGIFSALSSLEYLDLSNNRNLSITSTTTTKSTPQFALFTFVLMQQYY
ncbi:hypothetical protein FNV43_RR21116 [Rhamnella rubrinervis]|uniref:Leucine-rich repeat-containing N-terminal plant-type domain-containing protein n=1 Tax=Rhamnella rubrinervis TaxID=2594499 RepID=A0A8K0GU27_9ROSA|nr:hypothetical protein FNV43_RR21116 [Rhamnella rubrinervis]